MVNKIDVKESYIHVMWSGKLKLQNQTDWDEVKYSFREVFDVAMERQIPRILFDARGVSGKLSMTDRYRVIEILAKENINQLTSAMPPFKLAFVLDKSIIDSRKFGETFGRNQAINIMVTDSIEDAFKWFGVTVTSED